MKTQLLKRFNNIFHRDASHVFSCGGRFEILGNHTDHNHGLCLAATCDLAISGAVLPIDKDAVVIHSKGYPADVVYLDDLSIDKKEYGTSKGLIRGVAAYLKENGYKVGGFVAYTESTIFPGAGVSSSAAFEVFVGYIFSFLYNEGKIPTITLAKAGQYSENNYFGKASGLLDQIGVAFGNISYIDFENIKEPKIEQIEFPFKDLHFVIINTGGSHAALSHLYSAIPNDMYNAAKKAGVNFLRETTFEKVKEQQLLDIERDRALHFYTENERVLSAIKALKEKDKESFLKAINESRLSSTNYLKNMMV